MPVEAIHLGAPRKPELWTVESVRAVAGKGLEGDRHFHAEGAGPGQALTLVAAEVVEDAGLEPGETRRQITVRDVDVNGLVGKRFRVGEVECVGVELCEPCRHLESMTRPGIIKELAHRAGINADILVGGIIRVGDPVIELGSPFRGAIERLDSSALERGRAAVEQALQPWDARHAPMSAHVAASVR